MDEAVQTKIVPVQDYVNFTLQEKLNTYMMACVNEYGEAKLQQKIGAAFDLVSCVDQSIQESIKILPHLNKLKAAFGISDKGSL